MAVGGWWWLAVGGLVVVGGWRLVAVGGCPSVAVGGCGCWQELAGGGFRGLSLRAVLNKKKLGHLKDTPRGGGGVMTSLLLERA